ncbi:MAG: BTAD domain-containing putative transcriptional regulator [Burkholderiaceae bacterium]
MANTATVSAHRSQSGVVAIRLFGPFAISLDNRPACEGLHKRTHPRRLVQLLGAATGLTVSRAVVLESLWPELDTERAACRLHQAVHWLRKEFATLPEQTRPTIESRGDTMRLCLTPNCSIDVKRFEQLVDADQPDPGNRLLNLRQALSAYQGELLSNWLGCHTIDARRVALTMRYLGACREAIELAKEMGRDEVALRLADQLIKCAEATSQDHFLYFELLRSLGRVNEAVQYANDLRRTHSDQDPELVREIDDLIRSLQQKNNQLDEDSLLALLESGSQAEQLPVLPVAYGYDGYINRAITLVTTPGFPALTLAGPPGTGKTLVAKHVVAAVHTRFAHGAYWVDCARKTDHSDLCGAIARAIEPTAESGSSCESLQRVLKGKECLVVLDGLCAGQFDRDRLSELTRQYGEVHWLITCWHHCELDIEQILTIGTEVLAKGEPAVQSPTAMTPGERILLSGTGLDDTASLDQASLESMRAICMALDWRPATLVAAARSLRTRTLFELKQSLESQDGLKRLIENAQPDALQSWVTLTSEKLTHLLAAVFPTLSWLNRDDLKQLAPLALREELDQLIEQAVIYGYMRRRVRASAAGHVSEFRPNLTHHLLTLNPDCFGAPDSGLAKRLAWLVTNGSQDLSEDESARAHRWFERHRKDFVEVANQLMDSQEWAQLARLSCAHLPSLIQTVSHADAVAWLSASLTVEEPLSATERTQLWMALARVRSNQNRVEQACEAASTAVSLATNYNLKELERTACSFLAELRPERATHATTASSLGVDAGLSLMRSAKLALRVGEAARARAISNQAVDIFVRFGLHECLASTYRYQAKISFAMGDLAEAERLAVLSQELSAPINPELAQIHADVLRTEVLLSDMKFDEAIALASSITARPSIEAMPEHLRRAFHLIAWGYYAQGATSLSRAISNSACTISAPRLAAGNSANESVLRALLHIRDGQFEELKQTLGLLRGVLPLEGVLSDRQSDNINVAEIACALDRYDLAAPLVRELSNVQRSGQGTLRPWVNERLHALPIKLSQYPREPQAHREGDPLAILTLVKIANTL